MTDRELLELAAKAAGIALEWNDADAAGYYGSWRGLPQWEQWNPLTDDGDALRLAVKLGITIGPESSDVINSLCRASWNNRTMSLGEFGSGDPLAATRRAIVRAAAEIGRQHD